MKFSEFFANTNVAEGFSFDILHGCAPERGFAVSIFKGLEKTFDGCPSVAQLADYVIENFDILNKTERGFNAFPAMADYNVVFGGWLDQDTGTYYLDCSVIVPSLLDALQLAKDNQQLAVFDLTNFETVYV